MAIVATLSSRGTLSIAGTADNDVIVVRSRGNQIVATRNGHSQIFSKAAVLHVRVEGFAGDDRIENDTAIPSTLLGDGGKDTLLGGSGPDHLDGGSAENTLHPRGGHDWLDYSTAPPGKFSSGPALGEFGSPFLEIDTPSGGYDIADMQPWLALQTTPGNDDITLSNTMWGRLRVYMGDGNDVFEEAVFETAKLVDGGAGNDVITYNYDSPVGTVLGGDGNDTINDLNGGAGVDLIDGGAGIDTYNLTPDLEDLIGTLKVPQGVEKMNYHVTTGYPVVVTANNLGDTINVDYNFGEPETIIGGTGNDSLTPGGPFTLIGGGGNDTLNGQTGLDSLTGSD